MVLHDVLAECSCVLSTLICKVEFQQSCILSESLEAFDRCYVIEWYVTRQSELSVLISKALNVLHYQRTQFKVIIEFYK